MHVIYTRRKSISNVVERMRPPLNDKSFDYSEKIEMKDEYLTLFMFDYRFNTAQKLDKLGMRGSDTYVCICSVRNFYI